MSDKPGVFETWTDLALFICLLGFILITLMGVAAIAWRMLE